MLMSSPFMLGNFEIGNGYGVPGGGAYHGASLHNNSTSGEKFVFHISIFCEVV